MKSRNRNVGNLPLKEVISTVRNPITGDIFNTSNIYEPKFIDENKFIVVWRPVLNKAQRDLKLMAANALEKVIG